MSKSNVYYLIAKDATDVEEIFSSLKIKKFTCVNERTDHQFKLLAQNLNRMTGIDFETDNSYAVDNLAIKKISKHCNLQDDFYFILQCVGGTNFASVYSGIYEKLNKAGEAVTDSAYWFRDLHCFLSKVKDDKFDDVKNRIEDGLHLNQEKYCELRTSLYELKTMFFEDCVIFINEEFMD